MKLTAYKLYFEGALHISDARSDYGKSESMLHSDALYAALLAIQGQLSDTVNADLGCTISSLFPFTKAENGTTVYFFPKPMVQLQTYLENEYDDIKKLKRVEWLDKTYFEEMLEGAFNSPINSQTVQGSFLSAEKIDKEFMYSQVMPRVEVLRSAEENEGKTNIFYIDRTYFKEGSGLYFMVSGDTTELEKLLNVLQYEGIGTDRNVGFGHFHFERLDDFHLSIPTESNYALSLSLFNPENEDLIQEFTSGEHAAWEILKRGGWMTSSGNVGVRKKSVYMFREGSIFSNTVTEVTALGQVNIDLKPDDSEGFTPPEHPVWRSGRALFLPIKMHRS